MGVEIKQIKKNKVNKQTGSAFDFLNKDISFKKGISDKIKERFYSDLGILLSSGIDIKTALELIVQEKKKKNKVLIFETIKDNVIKGNSLSEAMNNTKKFSLYEYYSIKIGEETGRISEILEDLSVFYNNKIAQKRQIMNAFSYPILVLSVALAVVIFMMNVIVPMFKDVFSRFNNDLPALTSFIIKISEFVSANVYLFVLFALTLGFVIITQKNKNWYRRLSSSILLKMPLFGKLTSKIYQARFFQSMALLIGSKVPIIQALDLVKNMMSFYPYEKALTNISDDILAGKTLNESMRKFSLFDNRTLSLIKVAEEVNQLDSIFEKLNKQYTEEIKHSISLLNGVLEPIMIIFIGVMVGVILISMYLPLFQLGTSFY